MKISWSALCEFIKKGIIDSHNIYSGFSPETYEEVTKGKKKKNPPHHHSSVKGGKNSLLCGEHTQLDHHPLVNIYPKQRALPIIKS
jgi:hypothetical protein